MARMSKAKKSVDVAAGTVTFDGGSFGSFTAKIGELPDAIVHRLALHGLSQKCGDAYAGDVENPVHEARGVFEELRGGNWSTRAEGVQRFTLLAEALAAIKKATVEAVASKLEDMDDDEITALRSNPTVKAEMEKIKAARAIERAKKATAAGGASVEFDV